MYTREYEEESKEREEASSGDNTTVLAFLLDFDGCHEHSDDIYDLVTNIISSTILSATDPIRVTVELYNASYRQSFEMEMYHVFRNGNGSAFARLQKLEERLRKRYAHLDLIEKIEFVPISAEDHLLNLPKGTVINGALDGGILRAIDDKLAITRDLSFSEYSKEIFKKTSLEDQLNEITNLIFDILSKKTDDIQETKEEEFSEDSATNIINSTFAFLADDERPQNNEEAKEIIRNWLRQDPHLDKPFKSTYKDISKTCIFATILMHIEMHHPNISSKIIYFVDDRSTLVRNFHFFLSHFSHFISSNTITAGYQFKKKLTLNGIDTTVNCLMNPLRGTLRENAQQTNIAFLEEHHHFIIKHLHQSHWNLREICECGSEGISNYEENTLPSIMNSVFMRLLSDYPTPENIAHVTEHFPQNFIFHILKHYSQENALLFNLIEHGHPRCITHFDNELDPAAMRLFTHKLHYVPEIKDILTMRITEEYPILFPIVRLFVTEDTSPEETNELFYNLPNTLQTTLIGDNSSVATFNFPFLVKLTAMSPYKSLSKLPPRTQYLFFQNLLFESHHEWFTAYVDAIPDDEVGNFVFKHLFQLQDTHAIKYAIGKIFHKLHLHLRELQYSFNKEDIAFLQQYFDTLYDIRKMPKDVIKPFLYTGYSLLTSLSYQTQACFLMSKYHKKVANEYGSDPFIETCINNMTTSIILANLWIDEVPFFTFILTHATNLSALAHIFFFCHTNPIKTRTDSHSNNLPFPMGPLLARLILHVSEAKNNDMTSQLITLTFCLERLFHDILRWDQNTIDDLFAEPDDNGSTFMSIIQHELNETTEDKDSRLQALLLYDLPFFHKLSTAEASMINLLLPIEKTAQQHLRTVLS